MEEAPGCEYTNDILPGTYGIGAQKNGLRKSIPAGRIGLSGRCHWYDRHCHWYDRHCH